MPEGFEESVADAKAKIERLAKEAPPKSGDFDDRWGKYKPVFLAAQHKKCGYCEQKLGTHPGDVEHYRPKAALQELPDDRIQWGQEGQDDFSVRGRKLVDVEGPGYWWLAYSWSNYLAACNRCNSGWKRNLFPVEENPRPLPLEEGQEKTETPLLLNPFEGEDPALHLTFDRQGIVRAKDDSRLGQATIATCGLDRPSLVDARLEKAKRAHQLVQDYYREETISKRTKVLSDFVEMGDEGYVHAGMVRAIFCQEIDLPWDAVATWLKSLDSESDTL